MASKKPVRGQRDVQRTGMWIAAGVGVVFVGLLGWYAMHAGTAAAPTIVAPKGPNARPASASGNPDELLISDVENLKIPMMDRDDPHRQTGLIQCEAFSPLEARHYEATKPDAWLYLKSGRTLHVVAATGKLYMPDRDKEPESGTLLGGVVADLYEIREDGAKIDADVDRPMLTFKTQTLAFDATLGKLSTQDHFTIVSDAADLSGTGLEVLLNQVGKRLEFCRIGPGDSSMLIHPGAKVRPARQPKKAKAASVAPVPAEATPAPAAQATARTGGKAKSAAPPKPPTGPIETLYHIDFDQSVTLTQLTRKLDADKLQIWARTIDGRLPPDAIAEVRGQEAAALHAPESHAPSTAKPGDGSAPPAPPSVPPPAAPVAGAVVAAAPPSAVPARGPGGDISLHWTGPCVIVPLAAEPAELKGEHITALFTAEHAGAVRMSDSEHGASGNAGTVEYGATTGKLLLAGSEIGKPKLEWPNAGAIETDRIEGDLVHGLIHIPAPGELNQPKRDAWGRWGEQADFSLVVRDGAVTGELRQATFAGGVTMANGNATLSGGFARADFVTTPVAANVLTRLIINDKASASSEKSGRLAADSLDVAFALPAPGAASADPEPRIVTATGHVTVERQDQHLTTDWLEAHMGRLPAGAIDVASATARGAVRFVRDKDSLVAVADEMRADLGWTASDGSPAPRRQTVDLIGTNLTVTQAERSALKATQARLDGVAHSVEVFGAGTFDHNDPAKKAVVSARWKTGMTFNDDAGTLECSGEARAVSTPDPLSRDQIEGERITLALTPGATRRDAGSAPEPAGSHKTDLLHAEAIGAVLEREGGGPAAATSERFVVDPSAPSGRRRVQLQYLEGQKIIADKVAGTVDVPGPGKLVVSDLREERPQKNGSPDPSLSSADGDSLFTWETGLHMVDSTGQADMDGAVRLTHRSLSDHQITNLNCAHLRAIFPTAGSAGERQKLTSAAATGAVYVTVGGENLLGDFSPQRKELVADKLDYDAIKRTVDAAAAPGGQVSFFDPARGSPISAAHLFWDLANNHVEIKDLEPIISPRP